MQGPMLKVAPPQCLLIESFIYISCCRKYIRMMNGLRPLAELCMDVCYADETDIVSDERMAASLSWPTL